MDLNLPQRRTFIGPAVLWKRLLAFVIDIFVLDFFVFSMYEGIVVQFLGAPSGLGEVYALLQANPAVYDVLLGIISLMAVFALAYFVLMEYLLGQTPGKILMNMHVVSDREGKISLGQCFTRSLFIVPALPFIILLAADIVFFFVARKHQRFLEWLSQTRVVEQYSL